MATVCYAVNWKCFLSNASSVAISPAAAGQATKKTAPYAALNYRKAYRNPLNCLNPSTKAEIGDHDENISYEESVAYLEKRFPGKGEEYASRLRDYTIALYKKCAKYALTRGIIIADTKFEFGLDENGNMVIGDEMLTPDSSRFWPAEGYEPGHSQPSFDKQFARDWLKANEGHDWTLPEEVVQKTIDKYLQAYELLTGKQL